MDDMQKYDKFEAQAYEWLLDSIRGGKDYQDALKMITNNAPEGWSPSALFQRQLRSTNEFRSKHDADKASREAFFENSSPLAAFGVENKFDRKPTEERVKTMNRQELEEALKQMMGGGGEEFQRPRTNNEEGEVRSIGPDGETLVQDKDNPAIFRPKFSDLRKSLGLPSREERGMNPPAVERGNQDLGDKEKGAFTEQDASRYPKRDERGQRAEMDAERSEPQESPEEMLRRIIKPRF